MNLWGGNGPSDFIQTNSWLVPKKLIEKAGGWRNYRCPDDDGEFFSRVILASGGIVYVPGVTNFYRRENNPHKLSANPQKKYIQNTLLTIDLKYKYLSAYANPLVKKAFAKQYLDFAVANFPQNRLHAAIAYRKFKAMNMQADLPLLGGTLVELIKKIFGWKTARMIKHVFR